MADSGLVVRGSPARSKQAAGDVSKGWRWVGWLGLALTLAGGGDLLLAWYPLHFGRAEWQFATVYQTMSGLPLASIGMLTLLGAGMALGVRWLVGATTGLLAVAAVLVAAALALFALDVPLALQAATPQTELGVRKAVIKTVWLGLVFGSAYIAGAVAGIRHLRET